MTVEGGVAACTGQNCGRETGQGRLVGLGEAFFPKGAARDLLRDVPGVAFVDGQNC